MIKFNINDDIKIQLKERGKKILAVDRPNKRINEDKDGWSTWQLWEVIETFGDYIYNGCDMPFETNIIILD